jgi:hypothetical protein
MVRKESFLNDKICQNSIGAKSLISLFSIGEIKIFGLRIPGGKQAVELWQKLKKLTNISNHWPVILGDENNIKFLQNQQNSRSLNDVVDTIKNGFSVDLRKWFKQRSNEVIVDVITGNCRPEKTLTFHGSPIGYGCFDQIYIGLLPCSDGYFAPAFLEFGGNHDFPKPEVQQAIFQRWGSKFGVEIMAIIGSSVEVFVNHPPASNEAALDLLFEMLIYCPAYVPKLIHDRDYCVEELKMARSWIFHWTDPFLY